MRKLLILVAMTALAGACQKAPERAGSANGTAAPAASEAEKIVAAAESSWSSGDVAQVMANYADGAVVFDSSRLAATNDRNLITRGNADFLTMKPGNFVVADRQTQVLDADTIVSSGVLSFTASVGVARPLIRTRFSQVFQRQPDGGWKIVHEHMSSPPAGTAMP